LGGRILLKPFDYFKSVTNKFHEPTRRTPVLLRHANQQVESASFNLPEGWTVEAVPSDTSFMNSVGQCHVKFSLTDDKLIVNRTSIIESPFWTTAQYPLVKEFFQVREDLSNLTVVLTEADESATAEEVSETDVVEESEGTKE
jgi:hypothetical protein